MASDTSSPWGSLERTRATAFIVGGLIFVGDTTVLLWHLNAGTEPAAAGQALVGAAWTAAFVGLLGFYPSLRERRPRLTKAGAVFAALGALAMAAMAAAMTGYATGLLSGDPGEAAMMLLPGIFLGIVFGFGLFGVTCLLTDVYAARVGLLFLVLPATFLFNLGTGIAGFNPLPKVIGVVVVLSVTFLAVGYLLWTGEARAASRGVNAPSDASAG